MILPDINLLLYAYNPHVPQHPAAAHWWEGAMNGDELIGLPNEVSLGFVRIASHPRLGVTAVPVNRARQVVETWLALPQLGFTKKGRIEKPKSQVLNKNDLQRYPTPDHSWRGQQVPAQDGCAQCRTMK